MSNDNLDNAFRISGNLPTPPTTEPFVADPEARRNLGTIKGQITKIYNKTEPYLSRLEANFADPSVVINEETLEILADQLEREDIGRLEQIIRNLFSGYPCLQRPEYQEMYHQIIISHLIEKSVPELMECYRTLVQTVNQALYAVREARAAEANTLQQELDNVVETPILTPIVVETPVLTPTPAARTSVPTAPAVHEESDNSSDRTRTNGSGYIDDELYDRNPTQETDQVDPRADSELRQLRAQLWEVETARQRSAEDARAAQEAARIQAELVISKQRELDELTRSIQQAKIEHEQQKARSATAAAAQQADAEARRNMDLIRAQQREKTLADEREKQLNDQIRSARCVLEELQLHATSPSDHESKPAGGYGNSSHTIQQPRKEQTQHVDQSHAYRTVQNQQIIPPSRQHSSGPVLHQNELHQFERKIDSESYWHSTVIDTDKTQSKSTGKTGDSGRPAQTEMTWSSANKTALHLIPTFCGDTAENYRNFIMDFDEGVHENPSIRIGEKFLILKSKLTGEAQKMVIRTGNASDDYTRTRGFLKSAFGKNDNQMMLFQEYQLLPFSKTDVKEMEKDLNQHICHALRIDGNGTGAHNGPAFISVLMSKLPDRLRERVADHLQEHPSSAFPEIVDIIRKKIASLQYTANSATNNRFLDGNNEIFSALISSPPFGRIPPVNQNSSQNSTQSFQRNTHQNSQNSHQNSPHNHRQHSHQGGRSYQGNKNQSNRGTPNCMLCGPGHMTSKCPLSPAQQRELVESRGLCINCYSSRHTVEDCGSSWSCMLCGERHNTGVCEKRILLHQMNNMDTTAIDQLKQFFRELAASPKQ